MKLTPTLLSERYHLEERQDLDALDRPIQVWYIRDELKGKHGKIVGKFFIESLAVQSVEYLNHKKKIRKRTVLK